MDAKSSLRVALLGVVVLAVAAWAKKEFFTSATVGPADSPFRTAAVAEPDGLVVINYHGNTRCMKCRKIGAWSEKVLKEKFAPALADGALRWRVLNFEEPPHDEDVARYQLVSSTIVLSSWKDGREVKWRNLDEVWDHLDDEAEFAAWFEPMLETQMKSP